MEPIETPRLRVRELISERDAAFLLEALNERAFIENVGDRGLRSEAAAADYIRERLAPSYGQFGFGMWLVELRETGEPIGLCGLLKRETLADVDVGFTFLERYRARGCAFEAASATMDYGWNVANLSRIVAITMPQNLSSQRLLGKLGLHFEAMVQLAPDAPEIMLFARERPVR